MDVNEKVSEDSLSQNQTNEKTKSLIKLLLTGNINVSDFRLEVTKYSATKTINLFRDSLSHFTSDFRCKTADIFAKYFFNKHSINITKLWKYVDYKDFWVELKIFHDIFYTKSMTLNQTLKHFEKRLVKLSSERFLTYIEQKLLESLEKDPLTSYRKISRELGVSEKKITTTMKGLTLKGIYLGSLVNYSSIGLREVFCFDYSDIFNDVFVFLEKHDLFPQLSFFHGVTYSNGDNPSFFYVKSKKIIGNPSILSKGISIQDWRGHSPPNKAKRNVTFVNFDSDDFIYSLNKKYILQLMRNCEKNYKRPELSRISNQNDVSVRTLIRTKSKLVESGAVQPKLFLGGNKLTQLLIISKNELVELYNKLPFIESFELSGYNEDIFWLSLVSIFPSDFKTVYSLYKDIAEVFLELNKKQIKILKTDDIKNTQLITNFIQNN